MSTRPLYDVIVVGAGGSGLAAAVSAAQSGGRVLVLEKRPQPGGTTGLAVGSFTAAGTALQQRAGIADDPLAHDEDAARFAPAEIEARNQAPLRRALLTQAAGTLAWLESLGLSFRGPSPEPPNRVPRMHNAIPDGSAYIAALEKAFRRLGGTLLCGGAVIELLRDQERIAGVRVDAGGNVQEYHATRGVILAAGDYAGNPELIARHKGPRFRDVEGINPHATGDGQWLAQQAGARLLNMDVAYGPELRFVSPPGAHGWLHPENVLFQDGVVLVNERGDRFTNEHVWPERELAVAQQPRKQAYLLFDRRLIERYSAWPHYVSTAPEIAYAYVPDYVRLRPDVAVVAPELEAAAAARGIEPQALAATVSRFNMYVAGAEPDLFGRTGDTQPLAGGPWALLGPAKAYFTTTEGGAAINEQFQVLDTSSRPIPGLYAVGQNGLGGMILWGHGLHIAWALTSGRLAGRQVMET